MNEDEANVSGTEAVGETSTDSDATATADDEDEEVIAPANIALEVKLVYFFPCRISSSRDPYPHYPMPPPSHSSISIFHLLSFFLRNFD